MNIPRSGSLGMPLQIPKIVDFIPLLGIQQKISPKDELYHYKGEVSVSLGSITSKTEEKTELGGTLVQNPLNRMQTIAEYGASNPKNTEARFTKKEIFEDITGNVGVPEVVDKRRGQVFKIPKLLEDEKLLQDSEEIFMSQITRSNQISRNRRMLNAPFLDNPYRIAIQLLLENKIIYTTKGLSTRLRSTYITNWVITDKVGWSPLLPIMLPLEKQLCTWWQDIAQPLELHQLDNGKRITLFELEKNNQDKGWNGVIAI